MPIAIATWNVNSIRVREAAVLDWLERAAPDVVCLQETKVVDGQFPREGFSRLGYAVETWGERTYNGVATLSRLPLGDVVRGLPGDGEDAPRRALVATVAGIRIWNVYVPNGQSPDSEKFAFKLDWLDRLRRALAPDVAGSEVVVCGDFNVAPEPRDVHDPVRLAEDVLFHPDARAALAALLALGLRDTFRMHHDEPGAYSWWDYRLNAFRRKMGLRIDHVLASPSLASRCSACDIDVEPRRRPQPSDHAPVLARFD